MSIKTTSGEFSRDRDVRLGLQDHPDAGPDECLVVGDDDADHVVASSGAGWAGSSACTCQPPPGAGPAAIAPPKTRARCRMPMRPWPAGASLAIRAVPSSVTSMVTASGP